MERRQLKTRARKSTGGHDNGAAKAPMSPTSPTKKVKLAKTSRSIKVKSLTKELEESKARMAALEEALERERAEKEALKASADVLSVSNSVAVESSVELDVAPCASSTHRMGTAVHAEESRFVSSVNQLSVTSLNVPACVPLEDDDDINRHSFEMWKDLLIDSMKLAGIEDEATQFILFRIKAGPRLLSIFKNTRSTEDAPRIETKPFSNALYRLKTYFGSGSDIMLQRRKLALMSQKSEESDLQFVNRVAATARLCEFNNGKEFEEIIGTIAGQARNREVRTAALRMLNKGGSITDLVDKVREIETIRLNEDYYKQKQIQSEPAVIAPIRTDQRRYNTTHNRFQPYQLTPTRQSSRNSRFAELAGWRNTNRDVNYNRRGMNYNRGEKCWRCGNVYHSSSECPAIDKPCRNCNKIGHFQRVCRFSPGQIPPNASKSEPIEQGAKEIAVVEKVETESKPENVKIMKHINVVSSKASLKDEGVILAKVAGMECEFLIDSGAHVNTFTNELFRKLMTR
ncbi:uncharacterized protein LOC131687634 [Topomyia yanbarensis]|uniref:uncharacterized protein LOC131687634 n=1 Tax=Topomyia yanbarensis TaxID=2498891 RepID=UPI00273B46D0|nr:uncharacterized protein LOC131687634 [Topomyia yanbarensis]